MRSTNSLEITIPIIEGLSIKMGALDHRDGKYPTARLQKGLLLYLDGQELAEEGVGFGVPVLKRGVQTIFPASFELTSLHRDSLEEITVVFRMNLEEKIARRGSGSVKSTLLYTVKNYMAALIRRIPPFRRLLTRASNALRWIFGWETTYEESDFCTNVKMVYTLDRQLGIINVEVDTTDMSRDGVTEVVVMNEQGARHFDLYRDASGAVLRGEAIGCWDQVTAEWASFVNEAHRLSFTLRQVSGASLFRGRELVGARLAWSGFGYSFPPAMERISYELKIERF